MERNKLAVAAVAAAGLLGAASAHAATVVVTPAAMDGWSQQNFRGTSNGFTSTTVGAITGTLPRSGNGSVEMSQTDSSGKVDFEKVWGYNGSTLGNLTALAYDWYRASTSTVADHLMPALRLFYDADGNAATTDDTGYLIYERVYNEAGAAPTDTWVTASILGGNFWERQFTPGNTVEVFDNTLADWKDPANLPSSKPADLLSDATAILGLSFGIGSGWAGTFQGAVDNVTIGFGGDVTTYNFELAPVPEPATYTMLLTGLGLLGFVAYRRRQSSL